MLSAKSRLLKQKGFTLIEMILAVAIFALVGVVSAGMLDNVSTANEISVNHAERIEEVQRTLLTIERDLRQASNRQVRVEGNKPTDAMMSHGELILDSQSQVLAFRKVGWTNPMNMLPRSEVQSIAYRVVDNTLERLHFDYPDPVMGQEYKIRKLLTGVEEIRFEFHPGIGNKWLKKWGKKELPPGVAMTIVMEDMGELRRVLMLPVERP